MKVIKRIISSIEWEKLTPGVVARYILGALSTVNLALIALGKPAIDLEGISNGVYVGASIALSLIMIAVNTYKNNSTSKEAIYADLIMTTLKALATEDEKDNLIERISDVLENVRESTEPPETETKPEE